MIRIVYREVRVNMLNNDSSKCWFSEKELIVKSPWKLAIV